METMKLSEFRRLFASATGVKMINFAEETDLHIEDLRNLLEKDITSPNHFTNSTIMDNFKNDPTEISFRILNSYIYETITVYRHNFKTNLFFIHISIRFWRKPMGGQGGLDKSDFLSFYSFNPSIAPIGNLDDKPISVFEKMHFSVPEEEMNQSELIFSCYDIQGTKNPPAELTLHTEKVIALDDSPYESNVKTFNPFELSYVALEIVDWVLRFYDHILGDKV